MSHKATYWLAKLDPSLVKAGEFRVLFHLCDIHNGDRDPERACYPSQETLIERTAMSNGGLNKCLNSLEAGGFLTRKRSTVPGTSTRRTYYMLGCDMEENTTQTPQSGDSPNSTPAEVATKQTPLFKGANSTFEGGKLHPSGEEPVREPVIGTREEPPVSPKGDAEAKPIKARLPEHWRPSDDDLDYAHSLQIHPDDIEEIANDFHTYWTDRTDAGGRKSARGWAQAWRNRCRDIAPKFQRNRRMAGQSAPGGYGQGRSLASIAAQRRLDGSV